MLLPAKPRIPSVPMEPRSPAMQICQSCSMRDRPDVLWTKTMAFKTKIIQNPAKNGIVIHWYCRGNNPEPQNSQQDLVLNLELLSPVSNRCLKFDSQARKMRNGPWPDQHVSNRDGQEENTSRPQNWKDEPILLILELPESSHSWLLKTELPTFFCTEMDWSWAANAKMFSFPGFHGSVCTGFQTRSGSPWAKEASQLPALPSPRKLKIIIVGLGFKIYDATQMNSQMSNCILWLCHATSLQFHFQAIQMDRADCLLKMAIYERSS